MPSDRKASLLVVFLTVFIDLLGFGIVLPLLPIYGKHFAESHGLSHQQIGWVIGLLMSSFSVMQFLFVPVWGRLSDRFGRRPVLIVGLAGSTLFYAMFGVATAWRSLAGLFIARIGAGIAGATISTAQAYIADTTSKQSRAQGMALIGAAFALGFTLGPMIGAVALLAGGDAELSPWPGFLASALSGCALLLAIFKLQESLEPNAAGTGHGHHALVERSALKAALATPSICLLLATSFIMVFAFANFESTLSLQIEHIVQQPSEAYSPLLAWLMQKARGWGYSKPGDVKLIVVFATFSYLGIVLTLAQGVLVRRLAKRISESTLAIGGALLAMLGFLLLSYAVDRQDFNWLLWGMAVEVTGFAFVNPALQSLISRRSSPQLQGGILGLGQSASSLARIMGPVFGARLFAESPDWPYWMSLVLLALGLVMVAVAARGGKDYEVVVEPTVEAPVL